MRTSDDPVCISLGDAVVRLTAGDVCAIRDGLYLAEQAFDLVIRQTDMREIFVGGRLSTPVRLAELDEDLVTFDEFGLLVHWEGFGDMQNEPEAWVDVGYREVGGGFAEIGVINGEAWDLTTDNWGIDQLPMFFRPFSIGVAQTTQGHAHVWTTWGPTLWQTSSFLTFDQAAEAIRRVLRYHEPRAERVFTNVQGYADKRDPELAAALRQRGIKID